MTTSEASDRDTLALAILVVLEDKLEMPRDLPIATDPLAAIITDTVEAKGWRPPAQVITDPAEFVSLAEVDMVALDRVKQAWQCRSIDAGSLWDCKGTLIAGAELVTFRGPVTVLYVPTEEAEPVVGATLQCGQCGATATAPAAPDGRTVPIAPLTGWELIPNQHFVRCPACVPTEEAAP